MLQQKRMHDVEWEWLNVISMTQLSGAPILKNSAQFNNDITLAHARARAHTHTMLVPVTGLNDYKCKLIRGCSITVSSGPIWGRGGNSYQAGQVFQVGIQFEVDQWTNIFYHGLGFITTTYNGFRVQVSRKWG